MKRVVITVYGIVSCLGNDRDAVLDSLKQGRSGIKFQQDYVDMGMRSHIAGSIDIDIDALIDRKVKRFMRDAAQGPKLPKGLPFMLKYSQPVANKG